MTKRHAPPGLTSIRCVRVVKPSGPHQFASRTGSVNARHTSSRGALKTRLSTISRSEVLTVLAVVAMALLPAPLRRRLELSEVRVEPVEALFAEAAVVFDPVGGI